MLPSEESFINSTTQSLASKYLVAQKKKSLGSMSSAQFLQTYSLAASRKKSKAIIKKIGVGIDRKSEAISPGCSLLHSVKHSHAPSHEGQLLANARAKYRPISPVEVAKETVSNSSSSSHLYNTIVEKKKSRRTLSPKSGNEIRTKSTSLQKSTIGRKKELGKSTSFQNYTKSSLQNSLASRSKLGVSMVNSSANMSKKSTSFSQKKNNTVKSSAQELMKASGGGYLGSSAPSASLNFESENRGNSKMGKKEPISLQLSKSNASKERENNVTRSLKAYTQHSNHFSLDQPLSSVSSNQSNQTTKRRANPLSPKSGMPPRPESRTAFSPTHLETQVKRGLQRLIETDSQIFIKSHQSSLSPPSLSHHSSNSSFGPKLMNYPQSKFEESLTAKRHSISGEEAKKALIFGRRKMNQWLPSRDSSTSHQSINDINFTMNISHKPDQGRLPQSSGDKMEKIESQQSSTFISEFDTKDEHRYEHDEKPSSLMRNKSTAHLIGIKPVLSEYRYRPQQRTLSPPQAQTTSIGGGMKYSSLAQYGSALHTSLKHQSDEERRFTLIQRKFKDSLNKVKNSHQMSSAATLPWKRVNSCFESLKSFKSALASGQARNLKNPQILESYLSLFEEQLTSAIISMKKEEESAMEQSKRHLIELQKMHAARDKDRKKIEDTLIEKKREMLKMKERHAEQQRKMKRQIERLKLVEEKKESKEVAYLKKELAYQQARENKLIYFFYVLHKREFPVNDIYLKEIKDIPTHRFRVDKENLGDISGRRSSFHSFHESMAKDCTPKHSFNTSAFSSIGQSTFDQALVVGSAKRPKKPKCVPELDLALVPPYESSFEDEDDYADDQGPHDGMDARDYKNVDLGEWMIKVLEARPGEVQSPVKTFNFYFQKCLRRQRSL